MTLEEKVFETEQTKVEYISLNSAAKYARDCKPGSMYSYAPTLFLSSSEYNNLAEGLGLLQKETPELENSQNLQTTVEKTNNKLTVLQSGREQTPLLIWSKVIDDKPSGVKINSFSYCARSKSAFGAVTY